MYAIGHRGFTLLEAIIYFALVSAIVMGVIVSIYPLFTNTERASMAVLRDLESAFVFQKVAYLLNIGDAASVSSGTLVVSSGGDTYRMFLEDGAVVLTIDGGASIPLTSSRVTIENLTFTYTVGSGGIPDLLTVDFDANGVSEGPYTRYVRF
jgi:hypothetical protein